MYWAFKLIKKADSDDFEFGTLFGTFMDILNRGDKESPQYSLELYHNTFMEDLENLKEIVRKKHMLKLKNL